MRIGLTAKPWYVYRPWQLAHRLRFAIAPPREQLRLLPTSWGGYICADPNKAIGRAILHTGVHDLIVSELIGRLVVPGDRVVDAGANVGHMTVLAALAAGPTGHVVAIEPHPTLAAVLRTNVDTMAASFHAAPVSILEMAVSDFQAQAPLQVPEAFASNDGIASLSAPHNTSSSSINVETSTLDMELGEFSPTIVKVDVEGEEFRTLNGARAILNTRTLRHVFLEEHCPGISPSVSLLGEFGFTLFVVHGSLTGPMLQPMPRNWTVPDGTSVNVLASVAPRECEEHMKSPGWRVLSSRFSKQCQRRKNVVH